MSSSKNSAGKQQFTDSPANRLFAEAAARKERQRLAKLEADRAEMQSFSFQPNTLKSTPSTTITTSSSRGTKLPTSHTGSNQSTELPAVVSRLISSEPKRKERLAQLKQEKEDKERRACTFAPRLSTPTTTTTTTNTQTDWVKRLSTAKDYKKLEENKNLLERKECTFRPRISSTSSIAPPLVIPSPRSSVTSQSDTSSVHSRLYRDAMERRKVRSNEAATRQQSCFELRPRLSAPPAAPSRNSSSPSQNVRRQLVLTSPNVTPVKERSSVLYSHQTDKSNEKIKEPSNSITEGNGKVDVVLVKKDPIELEEKKIEEPIITTMMEENKVDESNRVEVNPSSNEDDSLNKMDVNVVVDETNKMNEVDETNKGDFVKKATEEILTEVDDDDPLHH